MARVQILPLPATPDDPAPFALVIDGVTEAPIAEGRDALSDFADRCQARAMLVSRGQLDVVRVAGPVTTERCVHCGAPVEHLTTGWAHVYRGSSYLWSCQSDSVPYGHTSHLPGTPCPESCLGSRESECTHVSPVGA